MPDGVVLLANGTSAFVEIDRTMSYARLVAKLERYDAYRNAPASGRGNADARRGACWCARRRLAWCVVGLLRSWREWLMEGG
ncbi:replication-relaxation family protein [Streptomyces sp. WI04-05B]|uniref:replication-relaxation family protein n=1 Tax=Streptomyces echiniscabiei TaxID=3028708 RepID=UPI0029A4BECC|nr:replication-relaxation family protein [Streptomyces sp. WI04-05B]MDX2546370.1 replication-relaxation family protein [Streptomyces sp. WI04-05B]MDX2589177.1 replication-relaxation family protein [Streptomyces sp. WI04-05A]MDX3748728.1 replication-relaxation family protein [Streptomyces sp. AK08-02]